MREVPLLRQPPAELSDAAADVVRLLADPTRRRIFLLLMDGEVCTCELPGQLRQAGLIRVRRDGRDRRWISSAIDRNVLGRVHRETGALFDPERPGERVPNCGPVARDA